MIAAAVINAIAIVVIFLDFTFVPAVGPFPVVLSEVPLEDFP